MLNIEDFADSKELFDGHYTLIRPLSVDGATADVWLALDMNTVTEEIGADEIVRLNDDEIEKLGLMVAIKIYRPQNALDIEGEQRFRDEYMIVYNCNHTNLIHPTHFSIFKGTPYLVLPYCKFGSSELLVGNEFENDVIWKYIYDVSSGLAYLHAKNPPIIHQDIKPANILLDDTLHYAITDFGISAQRGGVHEFYSEEGNSGTLAYMAPERFHEDAEPMPQSDVWAFGATLYEILTGSVPFGEEGGKEQVKNNLPVPNVEGVQPDIQRLIQACLDKEPGNRPTAQQISDAARVKQYPIKSGKVWKILLGIIILVIVGGLAASLSLISRPSYEEPVMIPVEKQYEYALRILDSQDVDSVRAGLLLMDSLSDAKYIPAMYQIAMTYGWYSDPVSIRRKKMLNISMDSNGAPIESRDVLKAVSLFSAISEKRDSAYPVLNADANFRLAGYYTEKEKDYENSRNFYKKSREWAVMAKDDNLIKKIDKNIEVIENYLNYYNNKK